MKFAFVLLASLLLTATATKKAVVAVAPKAVCYKKVTSCCWKYSSCGVKVAKIRVYAKCPAVRFVKKCFKVCKPKVVPGKVEKCYKKLVKGPLKCLKHPWLPKVCIKIPVIKKVCKELETADVVAPCYEKCPTVKRIFVQPCYFYKILHFPKACPKLFCDKPVVTGSVVKPAVFIAKVGKLVKASKTKVYGPPIAHKW